MPAIAKLARAAFVAAIISTALRTASADTFKWIVPTAAELSMTSDPKAPGAPAIILSLDQTDDGETYETLLHTRIKILTDAGLAAANVPFPGYNNISETNQNFYARTIHPDGSVIPFVSNSDNTHASLIDHRETGRVAALPSVTVGSIVEYGYHFTIGFNYRSFNSFYAYNPIYSFLFHFYNPTWLLQRQYFIRSAHFLLRAPDRLDPAETRWVANLPAGSAIKRSGSKFSVDISDVPAVPDEEFMPPRTSVVYNVRFFYNASSRDKFWGESGGRIDDTWVDFYKPRKGLVEAVHSLIQPTDSDDVKLRKLYAAVQAFENTDLTRARSKREDKQEGFSPAKNSEDLWNRKRGDSDELALLFVALARAAGYQAFPMAVSSRNFAIFSQDDLSWSQMDAKIAIVNLNGKDFFFDPGTKRCPFGRLAPWHAGVMGISIENKLIKTRATPAEPAAGERTDRIADLTIDAAGTLSGNLIISWHGLAGLGFRREAITGDEAEVRSAIEREMVSQIPAGVEIKLQSLDALVDPELPLIAKFTVSGKLGVATSKRLLVPAQFFSSTARAPLSSETRTTPVAFPASYVLRDQMTLHFPSTLTAETLPQPRVLTYANDSNYSTRLQPPSAGQNSLVIQRLFTLNRVDYPVAEYAQVHKYFTRANTYDQEEIVLKATAATTGS